MPAVKTVIDIRLIPARAGNTFIASRRSGRHSAHPRSRGEHVLIFGAGTGYPGSSPLARGTQEPGAFSTYEVRLIPARAGNTRPTVENVTP